MTKLQRDILHDLLFKENSTKVKDRTSPEYIDAINDLIELGLVRKSEVRNSKRGMLVATVGRKAYYNL